jgi:hypothetical protein
MMRRVRTTKNLAKRMDLQYFSQPHPLRSWQLWLSLLIPVVALGWFAAERASSQKIYSSGPLSAAHAVLGKQCNVCHVTTLGVFRATVSDDACSKCHDAPAHHADKVASTVSCGSCHIEHRGSLRLASTEDASCTRCHADLLTRNGKPQYARDVRDFDKQHPEFAALRPGARDPGQVKLNHYAHLHPNLASPAGSVQMDCQDCHRPIAVAGTWPYAVSQPVSQPTDQPQTIMAVTGADQGRSRSQDYMSPILYANQCAGCHMKDLQFDKRFDQAAPHDKPEVVEAFIVQKYNDYFASHPGAMSEAVAPERILPATMKLPLPVPHNRQEWIDQQVMLADRLLFGKGCKLCHVMIEGNGPLPAVAKSSIPARWFLHAEFNHDSHRLLTCTACHDRTPESRDTADILLPGIASCRSCHQNGGPRRDAASGRCSECHSYHDWSKEQPTNGKFTIPQLRAEK